jgi:hypothetical protein
MLADQGIHERFWSKVNKTDSCWLWTAATNGGYGVFGLRSSGTGKWITRRAHRLAWEFLVGPLTPGMVLDHLCRTPACINPAHLEEVTNRENIIRSPYMAPGKRRVAYRRQEFCKSGRHRLDDNPVTIAGGRTCRPCLNERMRNYKKSRKKVAA